MRYEFALGVHFSGLTSIHVSFMDISISFMDGLDVEDAVNRSIQCTPFENADAASIEVVPRALGLIQSILWIREAL